MGILAFGVRFALTSSRNWVSAIKKKKKLSFTSFSTKDVEQIRKSAILLSQIHPYINPQTLIDIVISDKAFEQYRNIIYIDGGLKDADENKGWNSFENCKYC